MQGERPNIRCWQTDSGLEPVVRVGIVLDQDDRTEIRLQVPDAPYELAAEATASRSVRSAALHARLCADGIELSGPGLPPAKAARWLLSPRMHVGCRRREGVCVRDVVAGRGFHWHKQIDQTFAGRVEMLPGSRGIILVNEVPLESYLAGVITAEMSGSCPIEFLRAQCIVARSWLLAFTEPKHDADPFDRCNDDCCQRYQGTGDLSAEAIEAVASTAGRVLVSPEGGVVDANYSKSCGGVSEWPEHIWGLRKPGLASIVDAPPDSAAQRFGPVTDSQMDEYLDGAWLAETDVYCSPNVVPEDCLGRYLGRVDEAGHYFRWTVSYSRSQLEELLRRKLPEAGRMEQLLDLEVTRRGASGRATEIALTMQTREGRRERLTVTDQYRIRQVLHASFLFSSAFAVRVERDENGTLRTVTLRGAGWGHGAGLCQIGALGMALRGIDHESTLRHYFPAARLRSVYKPHLDR